MGRGTGVIINFSSCMQHSVSCSLVRRSSVHVATAEIITDLDSFLHKQYIISDAAIWLSAGELYFAHPDSSSGDRRMEWRYNNSPSTRTVSYTVIQWRDLVVYLYVAQLLMVHSHNDYMYI